MPLTPDEESDLKKIIESKVNKLFEELTSKVSSPTVQMAKWLCQAREQEKTKKLCEPVSINVHSANCNCPPCTKTVERAEFLKTIREMDGDRLKAEAEAKMEQDKKAESLMAELKKSAAVPFGSRGCGCATCQAAVASQGRPMEPWKPPKARNSYDMMKALDLMVERVRSNKISLMYAVPPDLMEADDVAVALALIYHQAGWFTRFKAVGKPRFGVDPIRYDHIFVEVYHPKDGHWYMLNPLFTRRVLFKDTPWIVKNVSEGLTPEGEVLLHDLHPETPSVEPPKENPPKVAEAPSSVSGYLEEVANVPRKHKLSEFANVPDGGPDPATYRLIHMTELGRQIDWLKYVLDVRNDRPGPIQSYVLGLLNMLEKIEKDLRERAHCVLERPIINRSVKLGKE